MYNEYFFVLDALRADHIKYMPWLKQKTKEGVFCDNFTISEGFCERIEIFTNTKPLNLGFVTGMKLSHKNRFIYPYKWLNPNVAKFFALFEINIFFTKAIRRILWKICKNFSNFPIYPQRIPLNILYKTALTEDSINFERFSLKNKRGLLYKLRKKSFKIEWNLFTSLVSSSNMSDETRMKKLLYFRNKTKLFIPIYIGLPDKIGHKYGPHSPKLMDSLLDLDKKIQKTISELLKSNPNSGITIIGDHGMDSVKSLINVDNILSQMELDTGCKRFQDFDFFLDSTILRIWWKKDGINKKIFFKSLKSNKELNKNGYFIGCKDLKVNEESFEQLADLIWWAKKGIMISPDFFHNSNACLKGMHGYLERDNPSSGFCLRIKNDLKKVKLKKMNSGSIDKLF